jgi:hypothetical protein
MVARRTPLNIGDCAERNRGKAETRIGHPADAITRCADEANANSRERRKEMDLQTPPMRRPSSSAKPERRSASICRTDDWLRELFSGTYDLREAEARLRSRARNQPPQGSKTSQVER